MLILCLLSWVLPQSPPQCLDFHDASHWWLTGGCCEDGDGDEEEGEEEGEEEEEGEKQEDGEEEEGEEEILKENGSGQNPEPGLTFSRFLKHFILY